MSDAAVESTSVRVALRVRPLTIGETREGAQASVAVQDELNTIVLGSGASERSFRCVTDTSMCGAIPIRIA